MEDKKQQPISPQSQDTPDPLAAPENNAGMGDENDPDDLVHKKNETPSEENAQQDGDDAVHKNYKPLKDAEHENDERDADDMVHGGVR